MENDNGFKVSFLIAFIICIVLEIEILVCGIIFAFQNIDRTKLASVFLLCSTAVVVTCFICQTIILASYLNYKGKINRKNSYDDALTKMLNSYNERKEKEHE